MAQYIDKSVLVAEIERIKKSIGSDSFISFFEQGCNQGKKDVCDDLLSFLDTLEVKDVDFEKEKDSYVKIHRDTLISLCQTIMDGDDGCDGDED